MSKEVYEVLEVKGKPGLTVGNRVLKPGQRFNESDWPYDKENLKAALENKRCKVVKGLVSKNKTKSDKPETLESLKKDYDKLQKQLSKLKVGKHDDEIKKIEAEMKQIEEKAKRIDS